MNLSPRPAIQKTKLQPFSLTSVRVVPLSAPVTKGVMGLILKFHNEAGQITKENSLPKSNVQVILAHSFASNINSPNLKEPSL